MVDFKQIQQQKQIPAYHRYKLTNAATSAYTIFGSHWIHMNAPSLSSGSGSELSLSVLQVPTAIWLKSIFWSYKAVIGGGI